MSIQTRKQSIRQSIIAARLKMAEAERLHLSTTIAGRIANLDAYRTAVTVLGYMNFGAEFAAEFFVRQALLDGKQVLLPKVNRDTKQLDVYRVTDLAQDVAPGLWDIPEPRAEHCYKVDDLASVDFILLPGVAFTRDGARLGYGGGFYDKLLERITHRPALAAAAFAMQVAEDIPQEPTDRKVEWLITEQETIRCAAWA
ncbi:MAG: 5-formyltetrahydrofolate cyclo-ligase [Gallionellaceae bacterium]|nr:MAG: 5-formyltetrahydrofolate cyclo-ligase [Gallionellaceae bacterium]